MLDFRDSAQQIPSLGYTIFVGYFRYSVSSFPTGVVMVPKRRGFTLIEPEADNAFGVTFTPNYHLSVSNRRAGSRGRR